MNAATLFSVLVVIVIIGWLWFFIVRPIAEDFGLISDGSVNDYAEETPRTMSSAAKIHTPSSPSSLETVPSQTPDQTESAAEKRQKLLDTYRPLRKLGMGRDEARTMLKPWGIPLDNNLWAEAAPQAEGHITPIVGRRTNAQFESDPDFPYQAPAT